MPNPTASELLEFLISEGRVNSTASEFVESRFRQSPDSWYGRMVEEQGVEVAEQRLATYLADSATFALAESVSAMASLLLTLASRPSRVGMHVIPGGMPGLHEHEGGRLLLAYNPEVCFGIRITGVHIFGKDGKLRIAQLGLAVDRDLRHPKMMLVLPHPHHRYETAPNPTAHAAILCNTNGIAQGYAVQYRVDSPVLFPIDGAEACTMQIDSPGVARALQFPGAEGYFLQHAPSLAPYLLEVGQLVGKQN